MRFFSTLMLCWQILLWSQISYANNLSISGITLANDSTLTFNISWENSWRTSVAPSNHDAVWIFIKKKECSANQWSHVNLSQSAASHTVGTPLEVYLDGKNNKGLFLRRAANGIGNISNVTVSLTMANLIPGQYDFKVLGIEMVYIPQDSFYLGDGTSAGSFRDGSASVPFLVNSENAINCGSGANQLYANAGAGAASEYSPSSISATIPATFPKGYAGFYCMKYEMSQGQYVDFVNMLTSDQAANRIVTGTSNRLNISGAWPIVVANVPNRAMTFLCWADLAAYLDWAALRPMTELEFEKICRGPATPVSGEYAWGSSLITDANTPVNDGSANEGASDAIVAGGGIANYNNNYVGGPLRCGFAAKTATSRQQAAASYYGVMEISGNVWEQAISVRTSAAALNFTNTPGDGELTTTPSPGFANVANWPSPQAGQALNTAAGRCIRGGAWDSAPGLLRASDREGGRSVTNGGATDGTRASTFGGRGVR